MAIENIKQMTRPLSEGKKVASHDAPEDYLKRAVEQFIIEFPEFEDLQGQDLYDKMEEKGYFSDQYASDPSPYDMSGWYDMYTDMQSRGELPDWMDSFDEGPNSFMQNLDVLDISPWDFVQRKRKKEVQVADRPYGPSWEHFEELMGPKLKLMTDEEIEDAYEGYTNDFDFDPPDWSAKLKQPRDIRQVNQGGIIGLRYGGDPKLEQELKQIHNPAENGQQGIMQLASHSGDNIIKSAMIWMAGLPGPDGNPIGMDEVIRQLNVGETDMNGLVNAYMDARTESN